MGRFSMYVGGFVGMYKDVEVRNGSIRVGCSMVYCRSLVSPLMCRRNLLACCWFIKCPNPSSSKCQ